MSLVKFLSHKKYFIVFFLILIIAAFLRLNKIDQYMTFLGDEGRDALVVKRMLVDGKFTLLGPITSVGSIYMGPIYYYMMVPFLLLFNFNPVGPAVMVALFAVATTCLLYILGRDFFNPVIGLISAFLYAISTLPITFGRSSWNPNVVPFFSLLVIYSLLKIIVDKKDRWLSIVGLSLGILLQLHYVTFMFLPIIFFSLLMRKFRIAVHYYIEFVSTFILAYSPFLLFEMRHKFVNIGTAIRFLLEQKPDTNLPLYISVWNAISDISVRLIWRLVFGSTSLYKAFVIHIGDNLKVINIGGAEISKIFIFLTILWIFFYWKSFNNRTNKAIKVILVWIIVGIISFSFYHGIVYDYYLGSLFTAPYLLLGIVVFYIFQKELIGKLTSIVIILTSMYLNIQNSPLKLPPSNLLKNTQLIARFIYDKSEGTPYNFALIAGKNSDHAYRYFLETWGRTPINIENPAIDPDRKTVTSKLLIVCEEKECKPLGHPLWEIAGFGQAAISSEWTVGTVKVFKLVHYNQQ